MSHIVDIARGNKTCGMVAFLPGDFGLGVSMWVPGLVHPPVRYGSVAEEKELGNGILPDLDARPSDA